MKSFKRLLSLILCLAMVCSCVLVHADEAAEVIVYGTEENALITALGIAEYEEADLSAELTRGEFYMLLSKAGGYPETVTPNTIFSDLAVGEDYETWAKTLYKVGIITTTRDGKVNVGDSITGTEAVALIARVLGYGPRAEALGGYPAGYLAVAKQADVTEGLDTVLGSNLTKGMAVELLYNALHADMMIQSFGTEDTEYKVYKGTNLLNTAFGVEIIEGIVDVDITRVSGVNDVHPFHVEVDGFMMESRAILNPYDYLGYHVEAYYTDARFDEPKVIYMAKTDVNEENIIELDDIESVKSNAVRAYDNDKEKYVEYDYIKGVSVVVNGAATKQAFTEDIYKGLYGNLKLLDNTGDGKADIIFANVYENIIVSHYDPKAKTIYDKYDVSRKLVFDNTTNDPYVVLYDSTGKEVQPSALVKDSVVSVYHAPEDAYQKYVRAYISTTVAQGEIEGIEDNEKIIINGTAYELADVAKKRVEDLLKVGTNVLFRLDVNGEIADGVIDAGSSSSFAYIAGAGAEGTLDTKLMFKFYTTDGVFLDACAAKNIRIDGVRYQSTDLMLLENLYTAAANMTGASMPATEATGEEKIKFYQSEKAPISSIVKYALNGDGEVISIDTIMNDKDTVADRNSVHTNNNSLFGVKQSSVYYRAYGNHRTLGPKVVLDANSTMFYYPVATSEDKNIVFNEDEYLVAKFTSVVGHNRPFSSDVWAFYESDNQIVSNLVATSKSKGAGGSIDEGTKLAVVQGLCRMLDPVKGEDEVTGVTILSSGGTVKIPVKDSFTFAGASAPTQILDEVTGEPLNPPIEGFHGTLYAKDLKIGDVIRYAVDTNGYLSSVTFYFRPSVKADEYYNGIVTHNSGEYATTTAVRRGYVYQSFKEGCYVYFDDAFTGDREKDLAILETKTINDCEFVYYTVTSLTAYRYEKSELDSYKVSNITGADLKSYVDTGADCSFVILHTYNGQPYGIVDFVD